VIGIRRVNAHVVLAALGVLLAVSSVAEASSGGSSLSPQPFNPGLTPIVAPGNLTLSASGDGITVASPESAVLSSWLQFSGTVPAGAAGQPVEIERLGRQTGWNWATTVSATVGPGGSFSASWQTNHIGRFSIRALVGAPTSAQTAAASPTSAQTAAASPTLTVTVYRPSLATEYGPGFYGRRTACGQMLNPSTIGVANRTLRCGMPVAVYYHGQTLVVPVIDRGPYANGADWDLTEATGRALGIAGTALIGAVSLPSPPTAG
jgi:rare lipoprotein A